MGKYVDVTTRNINNSSNNNANHGNNSNIITNTNPNPDVTTTIPWPRHTINSDMYMTPMYLSLVLYGSILSPMVFYVVYWCGMLMCASGYAVYILIFVSYGTISLFGGVDKWELDTHYDQTIKILPGSGSTTGSAGTGSAGTGSATGTTTAAGTAIGSTGIATGSTGTGSTGTGI